LAKGYVCNLELFDFQLDKVQLFNYIIFLLLLKLIVKVNDFIKILINQGDYNDKISVQIPDIVLESH